MAGPEQIKASISAPLEREELKRETAFHHSRDVIRECRQVIARMVGTEEMCDEDHLIAIAAPLISLYKDPDITDRTVLEDPLSELAEAIILSRILAGRELPLPADAGLPVRAFALGICDAVGEMRRIVLNRLLRGEKARALRMYEEMRSSFAIVEGLTPPSGMLPLKKKQDIVRALLDRTAGELSIALATMGPSHAIVEGDSNGR